MATHMETRLATSNGKGELQELSWYQVLMERHQMYCATDAKIGGISAQTVQLSHTHAI